MFIGLDVITSKLSTNSSGSLNIAISEISSNGNVMNLGMVKFLTSGQIE